jgi:hypothetical protein
MRDDTEIDDEDFEDDDEEDRDSDYVSEVAQPQLYLLFLHSFSMFIQSVAEANTPCKDEGVSFVVVRGNGVLSLGLGFQSL